MENLGNLYIEPNLMQDERKATALQKKLSDLQCIDEEMRIVVQRIETPDQGGASKTGAINQQIVNRLQGKKDPDLKRQLELVLGQANNELNFSNFDICYNNIVQAISLIERSA